MGYRLVMICALLIAVLGCARADGDTLATIPSTIKIMPAVRCFSPCYSPDGKLISFLRGTNPQNDAELWVMDAGGQNARPLFTKDQMTSALFVHDLTIHLSFLPPDDPQRRAGAATAIPKSTFVRNYAWLPTSQSVICQVATTQGKGGLYQVMLDGSWRQIPHPLGFLYGLPLVAWGNFLLSPDGKEIAVVGDNGFFRAAIESNAPTMKWNTGYAYHEASWGVDGRIYCAATPLLQSREEFSGIYAIDSVGKFTPVIEPAKDERSPSLSPDGKQLAYVRGQTLFMRELATQKETVLCYAITAYRWLPGGQLLATTRDVSAVGLRSDPMAPREIREDIVLMNPGAVLPELRVLYRTTAIAALVAGMPPFYRSGNTVVDLSQTRAGFPDRLPSYLLTLPDISPAGNRMVYEWEGALYLLDLSKQ